jgi:glycosyltransferase involved in cell wall biosynthesis
MSLHRSEGFGFGPAEAMGLSKAVIETNWSGNIDYMRPGNSIGINYQLVAITQDCGPPKNSQVWAEPDLEQASQSMTQLASDTELARRRGEKARMTIKEEFSPIAMGIMMRKCLAGICQLRAEAN